MTLLERFRNAGISDEDILSTFQFKSSGYSPNGKRSYTFGNSKDPNTFRAEIYFNTDGELYKIIPGDLLVTEKAQEDLVNDVLQDISSEHGYIISHRVLFSRIPLMGVFQWKDNFRIRPCLQTSHIGKGLAWGFEENQFKYTEKHLGPPYPFILEVRIKKSSNPIIEHKRVSSALDYYQWLMVLLLPQLLGTASTSNNEPQWIVLKNDNITPEYHLAYEAFNVHESEIETGDQFSVLNIPNITNYSGAGDYYNHFWFQSKEIEMPVEMEQFLNSFENLTTEDNENFRRSLYWFNTGVRLYNQEQLSIISFTIAIECLLTSPSSKKCSSCGKPLSDGPTKLFHEFMEKNLSLPDDINHLIKNIYPKRSNMVHGSHAYAADRGFFSLMEFDDPEFFTAIFVRRALINWLLTGSLENK